MREIKVFTPHIKYQVPRWVELLVRAIVFVIIAYLISFLGISGKSNHIYQNTSNFILATSVYFALYYVYKLFVNYKVTNKVLIDKDKNVIKIHYSLGHLFERTKEIDIQLFSFGINEHESFVMGNSVGLYVYENKKFLLRINSRNGWSKKHIYKLRDEFLEITNSKIIKKTSII